VSSRQSRTRGVVILALVVALVSLARAQADIDPGDPVIPAEIRTAFQDHNYDDAARGLEALLQQAPERPDYWLYLKGLAQLYDGGHKAAIATLSALERQHTASPWFHKARFARAEAHVALRQFDAAEGIYEAEAETLLSPGRKDELAAALLVFADKLATPADESKPDSPQPDYNRACNLYQAALDLEISRALRDDVMYRLAEARQSAQNWPQAIGSLKSYLEEFDPAWEDDNGKAGRPGEHIRQARLDLADCLVRADALEEARRVYEDLAAMLEQGPEHTFLRASAMYRVWNTYRKSDHDQAALAINCLKDYLAAYPADGERSVRAAFDMCRQYEEIGRHEDAVSAYRDFLSQKGYRAESEKAKARLHELAMEAKFRLGEVYMRRKEYDEAKRIFGDYTTHHPEGPHWSRCQQGIIEADYRRGADLKAQKQYDEARAAWDEFLGKYPLDSRARQIMYDLGSMCFQEARDTEKDAPDAEEKRNDLYARAVAAWRKLTSKYPNTDQSSRAQFMIGQVYETRLPDMEKAIEEYRACTWGNYAGPSAQRVLQMTEKQLTVLTERAWRTNEPARIKVQTRNIESLTVSAYRLDLEDYFRKSHHFKGIEALDTLLIDPDSKWDVALEGYAKYKPLEQEIEVPLAEGAPGAFAVRVTGGQLHATTLVIRRDLDIIIKSSRKALLVFAQDLRRDKAWPGVSIIASDGEKVFFEGQTGPDGVFYRTFEELHSAGTVSVLAMADGHFASNRLGIADLALSKGLSPKGYIYTDRPAYRPGQAVHIKGILREVAAGSYSFEAGREYVLEVIDSQGLTLDSERVRLGEFGTIGHHFVLDAFAPTGDYTIRVHRPNGPTFSGTFLVERYKLERMSLAFELERKFFFRGEKIDGEIVARFHYGEPLAGREVEYFLPDGRRRVATTDANGKVAFTFDTRRFQEEQRLPFRANIVGENVQAHEMAFLVVRAYTAGVSTLRDVYIAGEPFEAVVRTVDVEQKPVARELALKVLKRESAPDGTFAEVLVLERDIATDSKAGKDAASLKLDEGGQYVLRAEGIDRFGNPITAWTQVFISDAEDAVKLRILTDRQRFKVGQTPTVTLFSRLKPTRALVTFEGEEILSYRVVTLAEGENPVQITVANEHFPNFALGAAAMVGNRFYTAAQSFTVERELKVVIEPDKKAYEPGETAKVEIRTTDQNGKPVAAELALAMVDEALLAVYSGRLAPIRDFFESGARRVAAMATETSCTFRYSPRTRPVPEALISEEDRLERAKDDQARRRLLGESARELARVPAAAAGEELSQYLSSERRVKKNEIVIADMLVGGLAGEARVGQKVRGMQTRFSNGFVARYDVDANDKERAQPGKPGGLEVGDMAGMGGGALGAARRAFPETAYWNPAVVTGKNGKATLAIKMPDSTTAWRLVARGTTVETLVGGASASVLAKKDFFVDIKLPAIVTEGDSLRITARVHNLSDYEGPVDLRLQLAAGKDEVTLPARVVLTGKGVVEHVFKSWKVPEASELTVRLRAQARRREDSLSRYIPVRPWGIEFAASRSGLVDDETTFRLTLPAGRTYTRPSLAILIDAGFERSLVDMALGRRRDVFASTWCRFAPTRAATASDLLGVVSVMRYIEAMRRREAPDWKPLSERAQTLIAALLVTQHENGGWAWAGAGKGNPDPYTSCRALWALGEAKQMGLAVPDDCVARAVAYVRQAFTSATQDDNELKAALVHALAVVGKADFAYANRLYRLRNTLTPAALAHTALVLARLDRKPMAAEVLDVLAAKSALATGEFAGGRRYPVEENQAWLRSDDEMTALALLAYLHVRPDAAEVSQTVKYLLARQPWSPAKARGPALAALAIWFGRQKPVGNDYRLAVRVNEKKVKTINVRGATESQTVSVPGEVLQKGANRIDLVLEGRGRAHYVAVLSGFSRDLTAPTRRDVRLEVSYRRYEAAPPEYKGKPVRVGFGVVHGPYTTHYNTVSQLAVGKLTQVRLRLRRTRRRDRRNDYYYMAVREPLPAGVTVLEGTISGGYDYYSLGDGEITFYVGSRTYNTEIRYSFVGYAPGSYRVLPTVARSLYDKGVMALGKPVDFTVLDRGEKSADPYTPTPDELYYLGKACFDDGVYARAWPLLRQLFDKWRRNLDDEPYRETARMLLYISIDRKDAREIVRYFEIMKEKYPELVIPFDKVMAVGRAYREIDEPERAMLVFKAIIAVGFAKDAQVAGVLEKQQQVLGSVALMKDLWREYPDTPVVTGAYLTLSDTLMILAPKAGDIPELKEKDITRDELILDAIRIMVNYLTLYPESPTADEAALNLVNAYLQLEDFESTLGLCSALTRRFQESPLFDSFQYVEALALWNLGRYEEAMKVAAKVAERTYTLPDGTTKPSDNRDLALYVVGQIWHAWGQPEKAIEYYGRIKEKFADAAQAVDYFRRTDLRLDEVTTFAPGKDVSVKLTYRNIADVNILIYRVDLMSLYLMEKNLSRITKVKLAGIRPALEPLSVKLGDGKDYAEKEKDIRLDVSENGAYLVICRGGELYASGLVLVTPVKLEVQEDKEAGRVRVNVMDRDTGKYLKDVHVKVVGSENGDFVSGKTDLRGIFVADDIRGTSAVIARDKEGQFAFYRGKEPLGAPREEATRVARRAGEKVDFLGVIGSGNLPLVQRRQMSNAMLLYGKKQKGVQVQQVMEQ